MSEPETPPVDPADADSDAVPAFGPLVGPVFWLLIASSLVCILAAILVAAAGPSLLPKSTAPLMPHGLGKTRPTR